MEGAKEGRNVRVQVLLAAFHEIRRKVVEENQLERRTGGRNGTKEDMKEGSDGNKEGRKEGNKEGRKETKNGGIHEGRKRRKEGR